MNYQAGALPLLQYALTELFERRDGLMELSLSAGGRATLYLRTSDNDKATKLAGKKK